MERLILAILISSLCICPLYAQAPKTKIGLSLPISGDAASYGSDMLNMLEFANYTFGHGRYELVVEDDKCNGKEAAAVARKFADVDHLKYVLGFGCSATVLSTAPIYEAGKVLIISSGAASPKISLAGDFVFRTYPSSDNGSALLQKYAAAHFKKIAFLSEDTDYGQGFGASFKEHNKESALDVIYESFIPATTDFRSVLSRMRSQRVEAVVAITQTEAGLSTIVRQMNELGWKAAVLSDLHPASSVFLQAAGSLADGIVFSDLPNMDESLDSDLQRLYQDYVKKYGPPKATPFAFIATLASFLALDEAIQSGTNVKDYLYTHKFKNIAGSYSFDKNGDAVGIDEVLKIIEGGRAKAL